MKKLLIATSLLALAAMPAHAQLLGGGGLTGGLGGPLDLNSTLSRSTETIRTSTRGAIDGNAATEGSKSVDRRSGRVEARRSANIASAATVAQLVDTPLMPVAADANGNGAASGEGSASAQLIGTDALRSGADTALGQARGTAGGAQGLLMPAANQATNAVPSLANAASMPSAGAMPGSASGSAGGNGSAGLMATPLAVAGSAAGAGEGMATIMPGMPVMAPNGAQLGRVREIVANGRGEVQQVVVANGDTLRTIPAGNLAASGSALVEGSGNASVTKAPAQDPEPAAAPESAN